MGKQRLGGNKNETKAKRDKAKAKKRTMAMEKESARSKEKAKILATEMSSRGAYEAALAADAFIRSPGYCYIFEGLSVAQRRRARR